MKANFSFRAGLLISLIAVIPWSANGASSAAQRKKSAPSQRPPLHLTIDGKPINRAAADRVSYAPIVEQTRASVVYVHSTRQVPGQDLTPFLNDPRLRPFFDLPGGSEGRAPDRTQRGLGSGVLITADGYILTNNHVVEGADEVQVSIGESSRRYDATVVGGDALADIAVLKIEANGLSPATFGDSSQLQVGDVVLAIGNPFGIGLSVSRGIVSALSRGNLGIEQIEDFIQTDAAINQGNSGGALIDNLGRVVGINTAILSRSGGFAGVGFAIPSNLARNVAEQIVNTGRVDRGFLGVSPQMLSPELADQFKSNRGALLSEVTPDSAAEKAGLRTGDIITKVNETEIRDPRQLLLAVSQLAPGTSVKIEYLRDGQSKSTNATLGRRPEQMLAGAGRRGGSGDGVLDGVGVADLTPQVRDQLQIPARVKGAVITQVDPASPSARQGLREGDVILELNRKPVKDAAEAVRLSEEIKGPKVIVLLWREGHSQFVVVDESEERPSQ